MIKHALLSLMLFMGHATSAHAQGEPAPAQGRLPAARTYRVMEGQWLILGRQTPDGGFTCSMTHVAEGGAYTVFTGLQQAPIYVHQSLFVPWTAASNGLMASIGEDSQPVPVEVVGGMAVIPLNLIQLTKLMEHIEANRDFPLTMLTMSGSRVAEPFPVDGARSAAAKQAECIARMKPAAN